MKKLNNIEDVLRALIQELTIENYDIHKVENFYICNIIKYGQLFDLGYWISKELSLEIITFLHDNKPTPYKYPKIYNSKFFKQDGSAWWSRWGDNQIGPLPRTSIKKVLCEKRKYLRLLIKDLKK